MDNSFSLNNPPVSKVPGDTNLKNSYALKDLSQLTRRELLDIKERQLKLLEKKKWLKSLPDKGKKIQDLYDRVVSTLEYKNEIHNAATLLSSLSLGSNNLNNLEWEGTTQPQRKQTIDSDDDEPANPLEILASSNTVYSNKKIIKQEINEDPLITEEDIIQAKEIQNENFHVDPVLERICKMDSLETPFRFLPHKSTEQPCPMKKIVNDRKPKSVQNTKGCEAIPLMESIVIEHKAQKTRQELIEKQAVERLEMKKKELEAAGLTVSEQPKIIPTMAKYRLPPEEYNEYVRENDEDDLSEDTISDEDEQ